MNYDVTKGITWNKYASTNISWPSILKQLIFLKVPSPQAFFKLLKTGSTQSCQEDGSRSLLFPSVPISSQPAAEHVPTCSLTVVGVILEYDFTDTTLHTQPEG